MNPLLRMYELCEPAYLRGDLMDLRTEAKQLLDGSVNRQDIHAQILTTINLEMAEPDPVETRKSIDMLRKKVGDM